MYTKFSPRQHSKLLLLLALLISLSRGTVAQQTNLDLPGLLIQANQSFAARQYAEAARAYERIVKIAPQSLGAHINLGICYGQLQKFPEAVSEFKAALSVSP